MDTDAPALKLLNALDERTAAETNLRNAVAMQTPPDEAAQRRGAAAAQAAADRYVLAHVALDRMVLECGCHLPQFQGLAQSDAVLDALGSGVVALTVSDVDLRGWFHDGKVSPALLGMSDGTTP